MVKSAYRLAEEIKARDKPQAYNSSYVANIRRIWDLIWKAKIPQKIKKMGWRIATNYSATIKNKVR